MEQIFRDLHEAYINSASGQKGCMICLVGIKNKEKIIPELFTEQYLN
ncbi:hypothetical protein C818_00652 [Lachnospiraceae bacterium MD308]|nr:hypothetical protein C818_00652 [Lachnospiraceae bacterium MD308]